MDNTVFNPVTIDKEGISALIFPENEVLASKEEIKRREEELEKATKLGNNEKNKIKIVFEDTEGFKQVETTVWATTDRRIILKGSLMIPIHRIHKVKIL